MKILYLFNTDVQAKRFLARPIVLNNNDDEIEACGVRTLLIGQEFDKIIGRVSDLVPEYIVERWINQLIPGGVLTGL